MSLLGPKIWKKFNSNKKSCNYSFFHRQFEKKKNFLKDYNVSKFIDFVDC